jgi:transposase
MMKGGEGVLYQMTAQDKPVPSVPDPMVVPKPANRSFTAAYRARIVAEYQGLDKRGKGALLRREGLYSSLVSQWKTRIDQAAEAAFSAPVGRPAVDPRDRRIEELERKVTKLSGDLDKARTVIEVQGKLSALLGLSTPDSATR